MICMTFFFWNFHQLVKTDEFMSFGARETILLLDN